MNTARNLSMANTLPFLSPVAAIGIGMTLAFLPVSLRAQDQAVTGNLTVNGNVGVGTTAPAQKLTISSGSSTRTQLLMSDGNTASLMLAAGNSLPGTIASDLSLQFRTGVIYPNADGNGVTALTIDSAGKVGIGTTTPTTLLQLSATNTLAPIISLNTNNTNTANGAIKWTNQAGTAQAAIGNNFNKGDGNGNLEFMTGGVATTRMIIDSSGNVGIGTIAPSYNLTVAAAVKVFSTGVSSFILGKDGSTGTDYGKLTYDDSTGVLSLINPRTYPLTFQTNATERMRIDAAGNVGIGTTNPDASLKIQKTGDDNGLANILINLSLSKADDTTGLIFGYRTDETTGIIAPRTATGNLAFYNYNGAWAETMRLTNIGNVGIGTSTPATKLEVAGTEANNGSLLRLTNSTPSTGKSFDFVSDNGGNLNLYDRTSTVSRLFVESGGSIGVGTTQPSAKLDVAGDAHVSGNLTINGTLNAANYSVGNGATAFPNTVSVGTTTSTGVLTVRTNSASPVLFLENNLDAGRNMSISPYISGVANGGFQIRDETAGTSRLVINSDGNVGIGTTAPDNKLTLQASPSGTAYVGWNKSTNAASFMGIGYDETADALKISASIGVANFNHDWVTIARTTGNVGIGTADPRSTFHIHGSYANDGAHGFMLDAADDGDHPENYNLRIDPFVIGDSAVGFQFKTKSIAGGANIPLTFDNIGRVGVGTTSPGSLLHVNGTGASAINTGNLVRIQASGTTNWGSLNFTDGVTANAYIGYMTGSSSATRLLGFSNNSSISQMVLDGNGNVGIGTTTPSAKLDIAGDAHVSGNLTISGTLNAANYSFGSGTTSFVGNVGIGTTSPSSNLQIAANGTVSTFQLGNNADSHTSLQIQTSADTNGYSLLQSIKSQNSSYGILALNPGGGNVGIGNTAPAYLLDVGSNTLNGNLANSIRVSGRQASSDGAFANLYLSNSADSGGSYFGINARRESNNYGVSADFTVNNTAAGATPLTAMTLRYNGNVGIGTVSPAAKLSLVDSTQFTDNAILSLDSGIVWGGNQGHISMTTGGVEVARQTWSMLDGNQQSSSYDIATKNVGGTLTSKIYISDAGNIGIGTTNPGEKLEVAGNVQMTGGGYISVSGGHGITIKDKIDEITVFGIQGTASYGGRFDMYGPGNSARNVVLDANGLSWLNGGNVGIGTNAPAAKLDVAGDTHISGNLTINGTLNAANYSFGNGTTSFVGNVGIGTTAPTSGLSVQAEGSNYADGALFLVNSTNGTFGGGATVAGIKSARTDSSDFKLLNIQNASGSKFLVRGDGNVGIGTANPFARLTLPASNFLGFDYTVGQAASRAWQVSNDVNSFGDFAIRTEDAQGSHLFPTTRLEIDSAGNVGIGTTTPGTYKLAVNGTIHAKDLVVDQNGWADYVLDPAYRNAPLSEVEQQIKEQGHLPGVPSAKDVAEKGVSVAQMQAVLLSKVEELTLHLIAQEKRIQQLEAENARLQAR
jgi:hypothetical protein